MLRRLSILGLLLALSLGLGWLGQWRALSLSQVKAANAGRAATGARFQQGQRLTVQFNHSWYSGYNKGFDVFGDGGCPVTGFSNFPNTPSYTIPIAYECKKEKLSGQVVLKVPAGPLTGTIDANGDLVLDSAAPFSFSVQITAQFTNGFTGNLDNRRFLDVTTFADNGCVGRLSDVKEISATPTQWSVTANSCSVNKLSRDLVTGNYDLPGSSIYITFFGGQIDLDHYAGADYAAPNCPASSLQAGSPAVAAGCQPTPHLEVAAEITSSKDSPTPVVITMLNPDGTVDTNFNGTVQVSLAPGTTDKIGVLKSGTQSGTSLSLALESGKLKQPLALQTPKDILTASSVLKPGDPVLEGKAVIKAELTQPAGGSSQKEVRVRSPLDLSIDHIEAQQGVRQGPAGLWVKERDLLARVFLKANRESFDKYSSIQGITAKLTVKDRAGTEITGSPFTMSKGAITSSSNVPNADYVFFPNAGPSTDGADSLNYLLDGTLEPQLSLEVKLDNTFPDLNPDNNSAPYGPLTFGISRETTIVYSRLRIAASPSTGYPDYAGIDQALEFIKQAYPANSKLRFVHEPDEVRTKNPFTGDPGSQIFGLGFYLSSFQGVRYVYFVDRDYFDRIHGSPGTYGLTNPILKFSLVNSDRCLDSSGVQCGTLAHEVGHTFRLGDTYVNLDDNGNDDGSASHSSNNPRKPNAPIDGNPVEPGSFKWFSHEFVSRRMYDFMGNSGPDWVDLQTWDYLKSKLLFAPSASQAAPPEPTAAGTFVVVQGQINKDGTASLSNCYTLSLTDPENTSEPGNYVLETLDANSAVLNSLSFGLNFRLPHTTQEMEQSYFSFALPFSTAIRQIRLRSGPAVLASRTVSANAPTARFVSDFGGRTLTGTQTVSWAGSDPDGDALTYALFYSPDGQLCLPLTSETTATSFAWKTDDYPAGPSPMLTLVATDGVNATVVNSRSFTLPNRPPRVSIWTPRDNSQYKPGEAVELEGALNDPEEGINLKPQLAWASDLQGPLGTGKRIAVTNLKAGTHNITATGADSQGNLGTASVTVIVRPDSFSNIAVAPASVDFGSLAVGQTRSLTLEVRNTGNAPFTVSAMASNNPQFSVTSPAVPFTVAARSPQTLAVRFTPSAPGAPTGTLTLTSNASNSSSLTISLSGKATGARPVATVSAASFSGSALATESIVAAFGTALATATQAATSFPLPTQLVGTSVKVKDSAGTERLAPLFFVAPVQINYQIPPGTAAGPATVTVTSGDGTVSTGTVQIAAVAPGLFTANSDGQGVAAALALRVKADGSQSYEPVARYDAAAGRFVTQPLDLGPSSDTLFLILFGTGLRFRSSLAPVFASLGGTSVPVEYAGPQGGFVGLDQVNLRVPPSLAGRGEVDVVLVVEGQAANTVKVNIK